MYNIKKLKQLVADGCSQREIGKHFGKSQTSIRYQLKKLGLHTRGSLPAKYRICRYCGKQIRGRGKFYCSRKEQKLQLWRDIVTAIEKTGRIYNSKQGRKYFLQKYGNQCAICKRKQWQKQPIPLVLDHIDGHADNNALTNLRLICPNCDAMLPTYKGRNHGNGRHTRRERYAAGKSY